MPSENQSESQFADIEVIDGQVDASLQQALYAISEFTDAIALIEAAVFSIDEHAALMKNSVDEHTAMAKGGIDEHTAMAKGSIDEHVALAKWGIDQHVATAKAGIDQHAAGAVAKAMEAYNQVRSLIDPFLDWIRGGL